MPGVLAGLNKKPYAESLVEPLRIAAEKQKQAADSLASSYTALKAMICLC